MSRSLTMTFVDTHPPAYTIAALHSITNPRLPNTPRFSASCAMMVKRVKKTATSARTRRQRRWKTNATNHQHAEWLRVKRSTPWWGWSRRRRMPEDPGENATELGPTLRGWATRWNRGAAAQLKTHPQVVPPQRCPPKVGARTLVHGSAPQSLTPKHKAGSRSRPMMMVSATSGWRCLTMGKLSAQQS